MPAVEVDLNTKVVAPDLRIWRIFPGQRYEFFEHFLSQEAVFLDLPGIELPNEDVDAQTPFLKQRLIVADLISKWIDASLRVASAPDASSPEKPDRNLASHGNAPWYRGYKNNLGAVINLFGRAKKGDLIILPNRLNTREILIGEFLDAPSARVSVNIPEMFLDESVPGRRVRWFEPVDEIRIPKALSETLRIPNPISQVSRDIYGVILENSYGSYVLGEEYATRFATKAPDFSAQNAFDFGVLAKLFSAVVADRDAGKLSLETIQRRYLNSILPPEYQPTISININSPGFINLRGSTIAPIFISAMFALFSTANASEKPEPRDVTVINSAATADDRCAPQVDAMVKETLTLMGIDEWRAECERAQRLQSEPRMRGDSRTRHSK